MKSFAAALFSASLLPLAFAKKSGGAGFVIYNDDEDDGLGAGAWVGISIVATCVLSCVCKLLGGLGSATEGGPTSTSPSSQMTLEYMLISKKKGYLISANKELSAPVGVHLRKLGDSSVVIGSIHKDSCFANTALRKGMHVWFINDHFFRDLPTAVKLLKTPTRRPSLMIWPQPSCLAVATVVKPTRDARVGLGLGTNPATQRVTITSVNGLVAESPLTVGMTLLKVNNVSCDGLKPEDVVTIIQQAEGPLSFLADEDPEADASDLVVATAVKSAIGDKVGVGLARGSITKIIHISFIRETSLFADSDLRVGMRVLKINNDDCGVMTAEEAAATVAKTEGAVTILAQAECVGLAEDLEAGVAVGMKEKPEATDTTHALEIDV